MAPHITGVVRHTLGGAIRLAPRSLCASLCVLLVLLASANSLAAPPSFAERSLPSSPSRAVVTEPPAQDGPTFRLGNAARPFGWSTVIGDFNTDGKPDVAVADHVGHRASRYQYRIGFSISGQAGDGITFESIHDALTITASDVDRDRDLDIVVVHPVSGETVGIWLNDGHGHFTGADPGGVPKVRQTQQTIRQTGPFVDLAPFDFSPQRHVGVPATVDPAPARSRHGFVSSRGPHPGSPFASLRTAPRAPPISSQHDRLS